MNAKINQRKTLNRSPTLSLEKNKHKQPNTTKQQLNKNLLMTGIRNPIIIAHPKTIPIKPLLTDPNRPKAKPISSKIDLSK